MTAPQVQIDTGANAVWVNTATYCIGRFGRMGIDIHRDLGAQTDGQGECLLCTHGAVSEADWDAFVAGMLEHHGVTVPASAKPDWWSARKTKDVPCSAS